MGRTSRVPFPPAQPEDIADEDDTFIAEVRLRSGRFSSRIEIPLMSTEEEKREFAEKWFQLMEAGIKCGSAARAAKAAKGTT